MKLCSIITGVTRPNASRVFENLKNTISTLSGYDCNHYALTYDTDESTELKRMLDESDINIEFHVIDPITENIGGDRGNNYRMFRCIELLGEKVKNLSSFDCVLRHRIDCELNSIEIPSNIDKNCYYAPNTPWGVVYDNNAIMSPDVFKKVFTTKDKGFEESDPHRTLDNSILNASVEKKPLNFEEKLYQSSESEFMGVPQWSKRNRTFHYNDGWISPP